MISKGACPWPRKAGDWRKGPSTKRGEEKRRKDWGECCEDCAGR